MNAGTQTHIHRVAASYYNALAGDNKPLATYGGEKFKAKEKAYKKLQATQAAGQMADMALLILSLPSILAAGPAIGKGIWSTVKGVRRGIGRMGSKTWKAVKRTTKNAKKAKGAGKVKSAKGPKGKGAGAAGAGAGGARTSAKGAKGAKGKGAGSSPKKTATGKSGSGAEPTSSRAGATGSGGEAKPPTLAEEPISPRTSKLEASDVADEMPFEFTEEPVGRAKSSGGTSTHTAQEEKVTGSLDDMVANPEDNVLRGSVYDNAAAFVDGYFEGTKGMAAMGIPIPENLHFKKNYIKRLLKKGDIDIDNVINVRELGPNRIEVGYVKGVDEYATRVVELKASKYMEELEQIAAKNLERIRQRGAAGGAQGARAAEDAAGAAKGPKVHAAGTSARKGATKAGHIEIVLEEEGIEVDKVLFVEELDKSHVKVSYDAGGWLETKTISLEHKYLKEFRKIADKNQEMRGIEETLKLEGIKMDDVSFVGVADKYHHVEIGYLKDDRFVLKKVSLNPKQVKELEKIVAKNEKLKEISRIVENAGIGLDEVIDVGKADKYHHVEIAYARDGGIYRKTVVLEPDQVKELEKIAEKNYRNFQRQGTASAAGGAQGAARSAGGASGAGDGIIPNAFGFDAAGNLQIGFIDGQGQKRVGRLSQQDLVTLVSGYSVRTPSGTFGKETLAFLDEVAKQDKALANLLEETRSLVSGYQGHASAMGAGAGGARSAGGASAGGSASGAARGATQGAAYGATQGAGTLDQILPNAFGGFDASGNLEIGFIDAQGQFRTGKLSQQDLVTLVSGYSVRTPSGTFRAEETLAFLDEIAQDDAALANLLENTRSLVARSKAAGAAPYGGASKIARERAAAHEQFFRENRQMEQMIVDDPVDQATFAWENRMKELEAIERDAAWKGSDPQGWEAARSKATAEVNAARDVMDEAKAHAASAAARESTPHAEGRANGTTGAASATQRTAQSERVTTDAQRIVQERTQAHQSLKAKHLEEEEKMVVREGTWYTSEEKVNKAQATLQHREAELDALSVDLELQNADLQEWKRLVTEAEKEVKKAKAAYDDLLKESGSGKHARIQRQHLREEAAVSSPKEQAELALKNRQEEYLEILHDAVFRANNGEEWQQMVDEAKQAWERAKQRKRELSTVSP